MKTTALCLSLSAALLLALPSTYADTTFTTLFAFDGTNGASPKAGLIEGFDGSLYGVTTSGGASNAGTIFRIPMNGGALTNLHSFTGGVGGADASGPLAQDRNGDLYGTTYSGGSNDAGTAFRFAADGTFTSLASFVVSNGSNPDTALVQADDGSFYGGAVGGPYTNATYQVSGYGSIFRITTNGALTIPVLFNNSNGAHPGGMARGVDGNFYGTTAWGGDHINSFPLGFGTVFRLSPGGTFTNLYSLNGGSDGGFPYGGLVRGTDGNFYGTAFQGGAYGLGTVFRVTTNGGFSTPHTFAGPEGAYPYGALIQGADGGFYGTTYNGGAGGVGTIFRMSPDGTVTNLHSFDWDTEGGNPTGNLLQGADGNLYGTTSGGGQYTNGTVFRLSLAQPPLDAPVLAASLGTDSSRMLTIYGNPGTSYEILYETDLNGANWLPFWSETMTNLSETISADSSLPRVFYRAREQEREALPASAH